MRAEAAKEKGNAGTRNEFRREGGKKFERDRKDQPS
jgi:hypothetical protein